MRNNNEVLPLNKIQEFFMTFKTSLICSYCPLSIQTINNIRRSKETGAAFSDTTLYMASEVIRKEMERLNKLL